MHKILWDFEIEIDLLDKTVLINKKKTNLSSGGVISSSGPWNKNERKGKDQQILGPCQRAKKHVEKKEDGDINCNWWL